uniref:hypothetical protein n=1 Tax=Bacillus sp. Xin1 TaxID=2740676 RepID=UPI001C2DB8D7
VVFFQNAGDTHAHQLKKLGIPQNEKNELNSNRGTAEILVKIGYRITFIFSMVLKLNFLSIITQLKRSVFSN